MWSRSAAARLTQCLSSIITRVNAPTPDRRRALWILGVAMLALLAVLALVDGRIQESGGPGIIAFEVAGSPERAREIMDQWGQAGQDAARLSLWLDFPYLLAYGAFWALAAAAVRDSARRRGLHRLGRVGGPVVAFPIAATGFDALENLGLLLILGGNRGTAAPVLAATFASAKFALTAITVLYVLAGLVTHLARRG